MSKPYEIVEAEEALRRATTWQLPEHRWKRVDEAVTEIAAALASRDLDALRTATAHLELAGPIRVARLGEEPPPRSAPAPLRDRIVRMVDPTTPADDDDDDTETD